MEKFAKYGFNKSHGACYALISYQTAYLKAHYPSALMAALMTSDYNNIDKIAIGIDECRKMKIEVLPPDVNESFAEFAVVPETDKIRFGMMAIKNVGLGIIQAIEEARKEGGKFKSIEDFLKRVNPREVNKKVMESLTKSGAFDSFADRDDLLYNLEKILGFASKIQKDKLSGQTDLFGGNGFTFPEIEIQKAPKKLSRREKLDWEKELLGIYISDHPLKDYARAIQKEGAIKCSELGEHIDEKEVRVGGIITKVQKKFTRNKETMLFVRLEDLVSSVELIVFPKTLQKYPTRFKEGNIIIATGRVNTKDDQPKLLVESARNVSLEGGFSSENSVVEEYEGVIEIRVPKGTDNSILQELKKILAANKGESETYVFVPNGGEELKKVKLPFGLDYNEEVVEKIEKLLKPFARMF